MVLLLTGKEKSRVHGESWGVFLKEEEEEEEAEEEGGGRADAQRCSAQCESKKFLKVQTQPTDFLPYVVIYCRV